MGLDVYLYRYSDKPEADRREAEYESISSSVWSGKDYRDMSESERDERRAKVAASAAAIGVGEYGEALPPLKEKIEIDSPQHPDHMFKVGYLRSSYNDGGFNAVARALGAPELDDVFQAGDSYEFQPDWADALRRATDGRQIFRQGILDAGGRRVVEIDFPLFDSPVTRDKRAAMGAFQRVIQRSSDSSFSAFSCSEGHFFLKDSALTIEAAIPGANTMLGRERPVIFLVVRDESAYDWYVKAWDIVVENCEWVLAQPNISQFYLHWSG